MEYPAVERSDPGIVDPRMNALWRLLDMRPRLDA
jgi:hypothetical protein